MKSGVAIFSGSINGKLLFETASNGKDVKVQGYLYSDLKKYQKGDFGCHVHKYGDPSIKMMGGHYDKNHAEHPHHTGDLPNARFINGRSLINSNLKNVNLNQLYGRSIVIHKHCDDLHADENGHSGRILEYAVIARS